MGGLWASVYSRWAAVLQLMAAASNCAPRPWKQDGWLRTGRRSTVLVCAAVVVAVLVKLDLMGPLAGLNFQPQAHPLAPLRRVLGEWPKEREALGRAEVRFGGDGDGDVMGPESLEFEADGTGPYTGVADGRVIRWRQGRWETFALVSPTWDASCSAEASPEREPKCGRPLGLRLEQGTGTLYLADAHLGLHSVGRQGGVARPLGLPRDALFANDLDVHPNGSIFFTDSSARWRRQHYLMSMLEGEASGRLLRHDPASGLTHVVLSGLHFPNGVAISRDASYLLLTETSTARVLRLWLHQGRGGGEAEVVADLLGYPDNIRRTPDGRFWVAINGPRTWFQEVSSRSPWLKKLILTLPLPLPVCMWLFFRPWPRPYPSAALLEVEDCAGCRGRVVRVLEERSGKVMKSVSEVQERDGVLWMGSVAHNQITTFRL